jgi:hypothetical protein
MPFNNDSEIDEAIFNPAKKFGVPMKIVEANYLTRKQKLQALKTWELDIRLNEMAIEENMPELHTQQLKGKSNVTLEDIHKARELLGEELDGESGATSKLGM